jgi:small-conductance mechanosensitive channel
MMCFSSRFLAVLLTVLPLGAAAPVAKGPPPNPFANQRPIVLDHLNAALRWYREIQTANQWVSQESDTFFYNNERKLSADILRAAFDSARAEIPLVAEAANPAATGSPASQQSQRLAAVIVTTGQRIEKLTAQKADLEAKVAAAQASGTVPEGLAEQRDVVVSQLNLAQAQDDVLEKMSSYYAGAAEDGTNESMAGMIAALERSVPEITEGTPTDAAKAKPAAAAGGTTAPAAPVPEVSSSILARVGQLYSLVRGRAQLNDLLKKTQSLEALETKLRDPIRANLVAIVQSGEQVNGQVAATTDSSQLNGLRQQVDQWTGQYRELAAVLVPLSQESALLAQGADNLTEWHRSLDRQYDYIIRILLFKTLSVIALIVIILVVSEVWRRATFKYITDVRRRRQFLLMRRIVTYLLIVLVGVTGFISDFSSLATFAGFITAGIAVALQSVILSVAAYFFLIGRYGVKVGDRVTISGVTGQVIDIGLVRVYLMEYAGTGVDLHPTGRVVVFANSALFSANPLFKQIPGTEFTWHEIFMPVKPEADLAYVKDKVLVVVAAVYQKYRPALELQHNAVERLIDFHMAVPEPDANLRFAGAGIELVVRYPLELNSGKEVDAEIAHEVLALIRGDEKLTAAISGMPQIRSGVRS